MSHSKLQWLLLARDPDELHWQENHVVELTVNNKRICLARFKEGYHAFTATCPHAGGHFSAGWIDALGNVVCPLHRYRYSMINGRNTSGEGYYLKTYPLELRADGLYIGFPLPGLFTRG